MRSTSRSVTSTGTVPISSTPYKTDTNANAFSLGFGCVIVSGTPTFKVQHCYDDTSVIDAGNATWFDHATVTGKTANADGNYASGSGQGPVTGVRVTVTAGSGTVTMNLVQGGV